MTQLMFARVYGGSVSQTELSVMWCLLNKRGFNYLCGLDHEEGWRRYLLWGLDHGDCRALGHIFHQLTEDGGERFITYKVLFSVGLLKTDFWGQGFFLQVAGDHFPVPIPKLTKVNVWANLMGFGALAQRKTCTK